MTYESLMLFFKKLHYRYNIEEFGYTYVSGWAYDRRNRKPCHVSIQTTDRAMAAQGMTGIERADLDGRPCGFRLALAPGIVKVRPQRFLVFVDDVNVADCHVVVPLQVNTVLALMEEGREAFLAIKTERLERELDHTTRRLGRLEGERGVFVARMEEAKRLEHELDDATRRLARMQQEHLLVLARMQEGQEALAAITTERLERERSHTTARQGLRTAGHLQEIFEGA